MTHYRLENPDEVFSPGLVFYEDIIRRNIATMIRIAGGTDYLIPHTKTHKTIEILRLQLEAGISRFKVSTLAEAEMAAMAGAPWVLLAYPLSGPNVGRFAELTRKFPSTAFSALVDHPDAADALQAYGDEHETAFSVFVDVNNGMNRTGVEIPALPALIARVTSLPALTLKGLHIYDGHLRNPDFAARKQEVDAAYDAVFREFTPEPGWMIIAGGTPSFPVHAQREGVYCSPGTCLLWDWGYGSGLPEQPFEWAALLLTRVVSKPAEGIVTVDLGHKAVSAENPIDRRILFLDVKGALIGQSEEHGVLRVDNSDDFHIGQVLYGVPYHVCPTVALHETATVVRDGRTTDSWTILSRKRRLTV
jgi:D-serine deaminase-like pyridoxal phosphate-dependent protein